MSKNTKKRVDDKTFIRLWESCRDRAEAASRAGMTADAAGLRAYRLRKRGVALRKFQAGGKPKNYTTLERFRQSVSPA
jgi:hypothetical protein